MWVVFNLLFHWPQLCISLSEQHFVAFVNWDFSFVVCALVCVCNWWSIGGLGFWGMISLSESFDFWRLKVLMVSISVYVDWVWVNFVEIVHFFCLPSYCFVLYGFAVCVLEVHVVDTPWKLWLELRTMTMEGLKTVGLIEAVRLCLHRSKFPTQLYTSLFG